MHAVVLFIAIETLSTCAMDDRSALADAGADAVKSVGDFEARLRNWPRGKEKERDEAIRAFFAGLKDRSAKLEAIAITDSRFVCPIPRSLVSELMGRLLKDPDPEVRQRAVRSLGYNGKAGDHYDAVVALLKKAKANELRSVIEAMASARDERFFPHVRELLKHPDSKVRAQAVFALRNDPGVEVMKHVMALWNDPDEQVRYNLLAFADPATKEGTLLLIERLRDDSSRVRTHAVQSLGRSHSAGVPKVVAEMLKDPHPYVRGKALEALAELKAGVYLETIAASLENPKEDVYVRRMAILALEKFGDVRLLPRVRARLGDLDHQVRDHAVRIVTAWEKGQGTEK